MESMEAKETKEAKGKRKRKKSETPFRHTWTSYIIYIYI